MTRNVNNRRARVARRLTGVLLASVAIVASAQVATAQSARGARAGAQTATVGAPLINRVVFQGNKKLKSEQLGPEMQTQARTPLSQSVVDGDIERIREIYRRGGRSLAKVDARVVPLSNDRVDVVFTIDEGDKTGVKEINFVGNNAFSSSRLRNLMTTTEMNFLSFLKNTDVYDPDRISADLELIRRYYLKNGYADFRVVSADAVFDAAREGYIVTITVDEGQQYRVSGVTVDSTVPEVQAAELQRLTRLSSGDVYNAEAVEKTLTNMTAELGRRGYPFLVVRPRGTRDPASHTIALDYVVEEGPRVYIERINVRGNTRSRDYVIRREFDIGEGDAYNQVLIDRAVRRLNNLGYFKTVRITNEPGSTPDRVVVNVDVEDQSTGQFSVSGGYSTSDGFIGEVAVSESNFLGRGQYVRLAGTWGQRTQGVEFSFTEPYFLGQRMAFGVDLFSKYTDNTNYSRYENRVTGGQLRLGLPITEEVTLTLRYSLYQSELKIPNTYSKPYNDCSIPLPGLTPVNPNGTATYPNCTWNGEASIAVKEAVGTTWTSLVGATLSYNTLDNIRDPRSGFYAEVKPEIAGLGGDSRFIRATAEARYYHELFDDVVGMIKVQGGHIRAFGGNDLRIVDNFFLGPSLVRGFAPSGIGPRDMTGDYRANALGGTTYFGGTLEVQFPIFGLPREFGLRGAVFADAGSLFGYEGNRFFDLNGDGSIYCPAAGTNPLSQEPECLNVRDDKKIRSSVGVSLLWQSPLGPLRFDYAFVLSKATGDQTQAFRFSGGTSF
ncbi:outer membrane protein assembly factor BamA [Chelatococcus daeguensis]|uniref:Outer membrane protein assembly factor BamA n=2 Tax=Chelatococcus TaxID=28209 RepID=A0AAC9NZC9_9HYPH|nr:MULTISPECIES: outer membrane protein assembly factor BamA [Chelatococcus]APF37491.1 outer membrane protein assembly factor BamA [Chelatococcus daeguensis]KZE35425.1 outer membrane protein assembly factor BamA [Chelatococcus daeguensis]MBM3085414.1 outer membrane protein assembly factor BamA [Chelatococcus daeguensis]CUA86286.1 Beta-barrel assembly machine subunit BamA [Chelatococcus sambhunathii]